MATYPPIIHGGQVEDATLATLRLWLPTYLGALPAIRSWTIGRDFDFEGDDQLPAGRLISPGTASEPTKNGRGVYSATWSMDVAVVVSARDVEATRVLSRVYVAAMRAALTQHPSLGGFASAVSWTGESYGDGVTDESGRTLSTSRAALEIEVADVLASRDGPTVPLPPVGAPLDLTYEPMTSETVVVQLEGPQ